MELIILISDKDARLDLSDPFLGLVFFHKHNGLCPAADGGGHGFAAGKHFQSGFHFPFPGPSWHGIGATSSSSSSSSVGEVIAAGDRAGFGIGVVIPAVIVVVGRARTGLAILVRTRSLYSNVPDLKHNNNA